MVAVPAFHMPGAHNPVEAIRRAAKQIADLTPHSVTQGNGDSPLPAS